jgi:hypothetical protein
MNCNKEWRPNGRLEYPRNDFIRNLFAVKVPKLVVPEKQNKLRYK